MDLDMKKNLQKEKTKLKDKTKKVFDFCAMGQFDACLQRIGEMDGILQRIGDLGGDAMGGDAMRKLDVYECAITCYMMLGKYKDALNLVAKHNDHGHAEKSFRTLLLEATCNMHLSNSLKAYEMFKGLLGHTDINDKDRGMCEMHLMQIRKESKDNPELEESINQIDESLEQRAEQNANELLLAELHGTGAQKKPSSSSTVKSKSKGKKVIKPVASSNVDPPVVDDESKPVASSSGSLSQKTSAVIQGNVDPPVVDAVSKLVASSSGTSYQKQSFKFSEVFSFEIDEVDNHQSYGEMGTGDLSFQKTFIKIKESVLPKKSAGIPTSVESKSAGIPTSVESSFLLKPQFIVRKFYVVDRVQSIQVFFQGKKDKFTGKNKEEWWEFIRDDFMTIFRGIICGLFAIHSAKMICGDLENSLYVTDDRKGRVFYVRGECFTNPGAQKDLDELLSTMESIVTLFKPRGRPANPQDWRKELVDTYKLPEDLYHFFWSLKDKEVANHKVQTTWLIDHPSFWPLEHKVGFFRILNDILRQGLVGDVLFNTLLVKCGDFDDWKKNVSNDPLLNAIYSYKGEHVYNNGAKDQIIHFIIAFINHANDRTYAFHRGGHDLGPAEFASGIEVLCPTIHTALYDIMCDYANRCQGDYNFPYANEALQQGLDRCSSVRLET